ncbi:unnamed protein product [Dibothriocephalus latus]|uniref:Uncharacterized protein n=1 Tax=Dibothriocephalus latus TaxID=60516 RepID=A0A3P7PPU7_DIBLA|nr:unnamed protein product [Dibothriocephalus latus]
MLGKKISLPWKITSFYFHIRFRHFVSPSRDYLHALPPAILLLGLYLAAGLPKRIWLAESKALVISSDWASEHALLLIDLRQGIAPSDRIIRLPSPLADLPTDAGKTGYGSVSLLDIHEDVIAVCASSLTTPHFLAVSKLPPTVLQAKDCVTQMKYATLLLPA